MMNQSSRLQPDQADAAVETAIRQVRAGDVQPEVEKLMFACRSAWLPHEPDAISFGSKETRESLDDLASRMLTAFLASEYAGVNGRVLGVEEEIRGMLVEGVPDLYGRVDLLTEDADSLVEPRRARAWIGATEGTIYVAIAS